MIDSLEKYRILIEPNPEKYVDRSGLYEILESAYLQCCQNNPWFNAYTEYSYYNAIRQHQIEISKLIDLEGNKYWFSKITLYCYREKGEFEIVRYDYDYYGLREIKKSEDHYEFGSGTFGIVYNYLRDWFDEFENLIREFKLPKENE